MPVFNDDIMLLEMLQHGDAKKGLELLFKKYYRLLFTRAFYMLEDLEEAEDLVQDLMSKLWEKKFYLSINTSLKAYLFRAVNNRCIDVLEKRKVVQKNLWSYHKEQDILEMPVVETEHSQAKQFESLQTAFQQLSTQQMEALNLVFVQENKYREASEKMGISINSVKTHLRIAMRTLRSYVKILKV